MTETILTLTIRHDKPLPELFKDKAEAYCYDWLTARNVRTTDVALKDWLSVLFEAEPVLKPEQTALEGA